ncbi:MAG: hypothetical protein KKG34_06700, partial [Proteobacteria bacterium]|nr:hypothetical protein [Pseudomonadota bacterium]
EEAVWYEQTPVWGMNYYGRMLVEKIPPGFGEFLKSIASIQKFRKEVQLRYILPTFRDMRVKRGSEFLEEIEKIYGEKVCSPIRYNVRLSEAPAYGQTIFEFAPGSNGAQDYRELIRKVTGEPDLFT